MTREDQQNRTLQRIERNILIFSVVCISVSFFCFGMREGFGSLTGCLLAYSNFRLIHIGVERLLQNEAARSSRKYLIGTSLKFLGIALFLIAVFYVVKPSILFVLIGFSLFMPSIFWETLSHSFKNQKIGDTTSGC